MRNIILFSHLIFSSLSFGQTNFYLNGYKEEYTSLNDSMGTFRLAYDTTLRCILYSNNSIKIYDKQNNLTESGQISWPCVDCRARGENWKVYYKDGIIKEEGDYYRGKKVNDWKYYYSDGRISRIEKIFFDFDGVSYYYVAPHLMGEYNYYETGQLKSEGQYEIRYDCIDSIYVVDPLTAIESLKIANGTCSVKCGKWNYYNPNGTLNKEEDY